MRAISFFLFFQCFIAGMSFALGPTEAGLMHPGCFNCKNNSSIIKQSQCIEKLGSEVCQAVDPSHRMRCSTFNLNIFAGAGAIGQCLKRTIDSFKFMFDLLLLAASSTVSAALNPGDTISAIYSSSTANYLAIEFFKAYEEATGSEQARKRKAALKVGGDSFKFLWGQLGSILKNEYKTFGCYNKSQQFAIICSIVLSFAIPTGGVHAAIRLSSNAISKKGRFAKKIKNIIKNHKNKTKPISKVQLRKITSDLYTRFLSPETLKKMPLAFRQAMQEKAKQLGHFRMKALIKTALQQATIHNNKTDMSVFTAVFVSLIVKETGVVANKFAQVSAKEAAVATKILTKETSDYVATNQAGNLFIQFNNSSEE